MSDPGRDSQGRAKEKRPVQRVNPNVEIYFDKINESGLSNADMDLVKKGILDQFIHRNESIVLEEEELVPDE